MADRSDFPTVSLNARTGALVLAVAAPLNLLLHRQGPALAPLSYVAWLSASFGLLCFCDEMGAGKPLNRAGATLFAAAFVADTAAMLGVDPMTRARAQLLYAFAVLGMLVFWSIALMHRKTAARAVGGIGAAAGLGAAILLVAAHLLVGVTTVFGFSELFTALDAPDGGAATALTVIDGVLLAWCLPVSLLLWTGRLRS